MKMRNGLHVPDEYAKPAIPPAVARELVKIFNDRLAFASRVNRPYLYGPDGRMLPVRFGGGEIGSTISIRTPQRYR